MVPSFLLNVIRKLCVIVALLAVLVFVEAGSGAQVRTANAAGTITATIVYSATPSPRVWGNCYINNIGNATMTSLHFGRACVSCNYSEVIQHGPPVWNGMNWNTQYAYYAGPGAPAYELQCVLWRWNGTTWVQEGQDSDYRPPS